MKIAICTFAYALVNPLLRMVNSAQSSKHEVVFYLSNHSDREGVAEACDTICNTRSTRYFNYGFNRGLARSLNDALLTAYGEGADVVINCNDDAIWGYGDVDRLAEMAVEHRECWAVSGMGFHADRPERDTMAWCVMAINPIALEKIGCLDQNFYPAYFEDVDYDRRANLLGLTRINCETCSMYHAGSLSITSDRTLNERNHLTFQANEFYWRRKWGGKNEFITPFCDDYGLYIAPENRNAPYGAGRDRPKVAA